MLRAARDRPRSWRPIYPNLEPPVGAYGTRECIHYSRSPNQEVTTMLKRVLACTAVLALCALPLAAQGGGHMATAGNEMTITGQVVDLKIGRASCRERVETDRVTG